MTATAKLFMLGKAQAVRIPARYRINADAVEITEKDGMLILRPKARTAGEMFASIRAKGRDWSQWSRPEQGTPEPVDSLER